MELGKIQGQRTLGVFVLAMLSLAVVISLRNLPLTAEYGLSSLFYYLVATLFFMIPYALVAAELASGWPKAGGVYIWVRAALGEKWGFFAVWMQWFHNMTWFPAILSFIAAAVAELFNPALATNKIYLISVILGGFWGVTLINFLGLKTSSFFSTICVILGSIFPGLVLIALGVIWWVKGEPLAISFNGKAFLPDFSHLSNLVFLSGVLLALAGLEANANLAREVKNPQKSYPRAIFIAAFLTLILLVLGSLAIAIVIPKHEISLISGLLDAFRAFFSMHNLSWFIPVIALSTIIGALGELNAWTITGAKGLFVTTESGLLPPLLHKVNRHHAPVHLLLFQALSVTLIAFLFLYLPNVNITYWILNALAAQMYILTYILMLLAGIILRYSKPEVKRVYKIPFGNAGMWMASTFGILSSLFVLILSFFPPTAYFSIKNVFIYEVIMVGGFLVCCLLPLIIYAMRKPHWKIDVLSQIREDIHMTVHD